MTTSQRTFVARLVAVGDDVALLFPDEMLSEWGVKEGDDFHLVRTPQGFALYRDLPPAD